ncbi:MAG: PDZ domain-containing protein [Planctomycetes bacterium]|nr:PDZ domain-containing protein [Planctomycetota bacterium]MBI3833618.1 PDZ domain-containing protein [Planctomycetota bacterium]
MHKHGLVWVVLFSVMALMFLQLPPMAAKQDSVLHTYASLVEVDALARQQYVDTIDDNRLVDGAIRGMMRELDPYSGYLSTKELPSFERRNRGDSYGVGVELGMQSGRIAIIAPVAGGPAERAGILAGDVLLSVDGRDLDGRSVFDVEEMLAGRPGTRVSLRVQHFGGTEPEVISITRGIVSIHTVRGFARHTDGSWDYCVDPSVGVAYVRVSGFHANTLRDFDEALAGIEKDHARSLILDLRFDPGGLMNQAVEMVDRFVSEGLILSTMSGRGAVDEFFATEAATDSALKLVVLVNGSTASAAEIVAGSLQAQHRAVVVGERSFGKGSVQHLIHLVGRKAAVKLTVALYRLPDGRFIHRTEQNARGKSWGIQPDVEVRLGDDETKAIQRSRQAVDNATDLDRSAGSTGINTAFPRTILLDRQLEAAIQVARGTLGPSS